VAITRTDGFVDLRVSPTVSGRSDEDSVWPSFTDIMTVVVLIFLVALVIILMRNTELVGQLRESVSQTETMTTQRGEMEMRIATLGDEVVRLRSVLAQAEAERSAAEETIVLKESEISALLDDVGEMQKVRQALASEKADLTEELAAVENERQQLSTEKAALSEELAGVTSEREQLSEEKTALLATQQQLEDSLVSLEQDRAALQGVKESLQAEVAGLIATRQQLSTEKAALSEELAGVTSEREQLSEEKTALLATQQQLEDSLVSLEQDRAALQGVKESLQAEVAGLIATRQQLSTEKAALSEELAGVIAQSQNQLEQLAASEGLREQLSLDLTNLNNALSELQSEQSRLILAAEARAQYQATVVQARDALLRDRDALAEQVNALEVTRSALRTEVVALRNERAGLVRTSVSTQLALEESRLEGEELTARLAETALEYKLTKEELAYLRAQYADEVEAFSKERELLGAIHKAELDILRERHSDLESKYNRLVRPARSTVGRIVIEVRFWKEGDVRRYSLRPASGSEISVSESELHQQLTAMKARHGEKLYTKVMPDDNSLTHGEAWRFTNKILNRYDYYYQN